jgi:hypothetical protein
MIAASSQLCVLRPHPSCRQPARKSPVADARRDKDKTTEARCDCRTLPYLSKSVHVFLLEGDGKTSRLTRTLRLQCEERYPCQNCTKRGESCRPPRVAARKKDNKDDVILSKIIPKELDLRPPSLEFVGDESVNMLHMELFYHFEQVTIPTLCFSVIWPPLLQLAFRV